MLDIKYLYIIFFLVILIISFLDYKRRCYKDIEGFDTQKKPFNYICDPSLDKTQYTGQSVEQLKSICKDQPSPENLAFPLLKNSKVVNGTTLSTFSTSNLKYLSNNNSFLKLSSEKPKVANVNVADKELMRDECIDDCNNDVNCNFALVGKSNNIGDNNTFNRLGVCRTFKSGTNQIPVPVGFDVYSKKNSIEYSIEFYLKINHLVNGWRSILHIGNMDQKRFPGIWIHPNSLALHFGVRTSVCTNFTDNYQEVFNTQTLPDKVWNHVVFTVQGNNISFYLNGEFKSKSQFKGFVEWSDEEQNVYVVDPWYLGNATGYELGKVNWYPLLLPDEFIKVISNEKANLSTDWRCLPNANDRTPIRLNGDGDVECAASNGADCHWKGTLNECNAVIANMPTPIKPLTCGPSAYQNIGHWCSYGKSYLNEIENGACKAYGLDKKNLSNECLLSIWKSQGCTNEDMLKNYSEDGWWKKQTRAVVESDMNAWATLSDDTHRNACYGTDRNKWPEAQKFTKLKNMDKGGFDIQCIRGASEDVCKTKCLNDPNCQSSNYVHPNGAWGKDSGCCYKTTKQNPYPIDKIDFYVRKDVPQQWDNVPGQLKQVSNSGSVVCGVNANDDIYCMTDGQNGWGQLYGKLRNISVDGVKACGTNAGNDIWCTDNVNTPNWIQVNGSAKVIDMDNGKMIIVSSDNDKLYVADFKKSNWKLIDNTKTFKHVSIFNKSIAAVDTNFDMWYAADYDTPNWRKLSGKWLYVNIDNGNICGINTENAVFCGDTTGNWNQKPGKLGSISTSGPVSYATNSANNSNFGSNIFRMVNLYNSNSDNKLACETKYTNWDAAGGKRTNFLDRQNIQCGSDKFLNQFQLEYDAKSDRARYKYKCCPIDNSKHTSTLIQKTTPKNDSGNWDARYIDRHNLTCNDNFGMNQLVFQSFYDSPTGNMRYSYNCINVNNKQNNQKVNTTTRTINTEMVSEGADLDKLAPLNVRCDDNEAISNLQLKRTPFNNQFFYQYNCKKMK